MTSFLVNPTPPTSVSRRPTVGSALITRRLCSQMLRYSRCTADSRLTSAQRQHLGTEWHSSGMSASGKRQANIGKSPRCSESPWWCWDGHSALVGVSSFASRYALRGVTTKFCLGGRAHGTQEGAHPREGPGGSGPFVFATRILKLFAICKDRGSL